jgi:hypothetical protein
MRVARAGRLRTIRALPSWFQRPHALRNGGRGQVQLQRRLLEAARFDDGAERFRVLGIQVHGARLT